MSDRQNYIPAGAITKAEHDEIVELLGRPLTQPPIGAHRKMMMPDGFAQVRDLGELAE